jgi:hypothetical protein
MMMNKTKFLIAFILGLVFALAGEKNEGSLSYAGKLGYTSAYDSLFVGLDISSPISSNSSFVISLEYLHWSNKRLGVVEDKYTGVPLLLTFQKSSSKEGTSYFGIGGGIYYWEKETEVLFGTVKSESKWKAGFHILVGLRISPKIFSELRWSSVGKFEDGDSGSFAFILGIRF